MKTPWTEHAFWSRSARWLCRFDEDGVFIYSTDQGIYDTQKECCIMLLGLPPEKVIVENKLVGGGFGGKEDVSVRHHSALIAISDETDRKSEIIQTGEYHDPRSDIDVDGHYDGM